MSPHQVDIEKVSRHLVRILRHSRLDDPQGWVRIRDLPYTGQVVEKVIATSCRGRVPRFECSADALHVRATDKRTNMGFSR